MRRRLHLRQPRIRTLEIFRREAAQIGAEGGEVPAVGEDPEARGLERLSEGDTLEVPTGRSVLDVLQLSGIYADGHLVARDEERRQRFRADLRWHQGEHDPNPRGWKRIDTLAQVDPSWFCQLMPDETRPIRFAVIDSDTGSVETFTTLTLKRVAGQAQRITFREADRDEITLDDWLAVHVGGWDCAEVRAAVRAAAGGLLPVLQAMRPRDLSRELPLSRWDPAARDAFLEAARDLRAGELGIERGASARYEAEACDSLANSAHRCACAARLTTSTTNDADDDLANLCQLEVRRWVKGSDPADATVDLLSLDANDVAVVLEETDATFIEVRLVDATGNKQPIEDLRVSLAMKIYPQNGEDDVDGQLNVARTVELRLENELGRAAREAKTEGERAAQAEYDRARAAVTAQRQAGFFRRPISAFWTVPFSASSVASNGPSFRIRSSRPHRWRGSSTSSGTTSARSSAPRARRTRGGRSRPRARRRPPPRPRARPPRTRTTRRSPASTGSARTRRPTRS